jgi:hypothetical protein
MAAGDRAQYVNIDVSKSLRRPGVEDAQGRREAQHSTPHCPCACSMRAEHRARHQTLYRMSLWSCRMRVGEGSCVFLSLCTQLTSRHPLWALFPTRKPTSIVYTCCNATPDRSRSFFYPLLHSQQQQHDPCPGLPAVSLLSGKPGCGPTSWHRQGHGPWHGPWHDGRPGWHDAWPGHDGSRQQRHRTRRHDGRRRWWRHGHGLWW